MTTPFASIWTNKDTQERGPTVDEQAADITTDFAELTTVLHVATDGPHGLWTVAVTLDAENAVSLIEKIAERYGLTVAPQVLGEQDRADIVDAIDYAGEDLSYRTDQGKDYEDVAAIKVKLARWAALTSRLIDVAPEAPQVLDEPPLPDGEPVTTWGEALGTDEGPAFYQTPEDPS